MTPANALEIIKTLPNPVTGKIARTIKQLNEWGTTFSQNNIRWLESQIISVVSISNVVTQIGEDIKSEYAKTREKMSDLMALYRTDTDEHRRAREASLEHICELEKKYAEEIKNNELFKTELLADNKQFKDEMRKDGKTFMFWILAITATGILINNFLAPLIIKLVFHAHTGQ